jgi:serine/threonine protein kinase/tetratricopeptide (TPR) repeat protein
LLDETVVLAGRPLVCPVCGIAASEADATEMLTDISPPADRADLQTGGTLVGTHTPVEPPREAAPHASNVFPSLPGYEILGMLGRGGMGVVYCARDLRRHKVVALKTMQWLDPGTLYRFKQEFRALAGLAHPNLITLYELVSDGRDWFFTMELIEGRNFLQHVRRPVEGSRGVPSGSANPPGQTTFTQPLAPVDMAALRASLPQLVSGILVLHEAGKLHRDIKPSNVLVTREGRVVLLDFGLAVEMDSSGVHRSTEQHLLGTAAYMAPEQARSQPVTAASDWYAVGVMLYEALTGRLPFEGTVVEMLQNKQSFDPPPPGVLMRGIPVDLNALTVALMQRDPEVRPSGPEILERLAVSHHEIVTKSHSDRLVGRKRHLEALADAFAVASRQGQTVVLHVHGRSGAGKSTLVRYFLDSLKEREQVVILSGQCYEQEAVPYKALDSLVDALSRYLIRLPPLEAEALLPRDVLALARVFPVLARVPAVEQAPRRLLNLCDPQEVRRRALAALRELLGRLADRRPVVLFIDDLQWGDTDSAVLLADLLRPPDAPTLLLLLGYRSEEARVSPCLREIDKITAEASLVDRRELAVEPLTSEEAVELALSLLDPADPTAQSQAEAIAQESGGNAFFVHELVQHALQCTPVAGADAAFVPASFDITLPEVIWQRVQRLPAEARRLLEVVAVAGRPLPQTAACQAAGLDQDEFPTLAQLRAGRLVRSTGPAERHAIESYHDRIREAIVAHLGPAALQEYHRSLAQALQASGKADPELLAVHYQGAGEDAKAGKYYALAAAQAADALAFDRAVKLYRQALQLRRRPSGLEPVVEDCALRTSLGDALANAGRGAESAREYLVAAAASASASDALELQRRAALQFLSSGHVDEGLTTLSGVLKTVGMDLARTPRRAFWSLVFRRAQLRLRGLGYRPRPVSQLSAEELRRINICWSAAAGLSMVDTIQGAYFHTRALLFALDAGEPYYLARALAWEGGHVSLGGGCTQNRTSRIFDAADRLAQQADHPYLRGIVAMFRGIAAAFSGEWRRALFLCDQAESILRDACTWHAMAGNVLGGKVQTPVYELDTAHRFALWALMFMGDVPEMARRLPMLLKEAQERDDLYAVMNLTLAVGTLVRLAADEPERAQQEIAQVMARWSRRGFHVQHLNYLADEALIAMYRGEAKKAWDILAHGWGSYARSHFVRVPQVRIVMWDLRARIALAAARAAANPQPLLRSAERDARALQKEGSAWSDGLSCLIRAGVCLARAAAGSAPAAAGVALLREAAASLAKFDMPHYAVAARHLLGRVLGGDEGRSLTAQAETWMRERKIHNPVRFIAMLAPTPRMLE